MTWLSNKTNLFKAGWIMVDDSEKRIIDNNELANKKIEAYHEEEARRLMAERQENGEEVLYDGFSEGIGYDQIDAFDENNNIIGAEAPEVTEGFQEGLSDDYSGMEYDENAVMGMADEDMGLGMELDSEQVPEPEPIPEEEEVPQINLEEIQAQIDEQLRMADEQAQQIIAEAQAQADELRHHAMEEGRQAGYDEGYQQGAQEAEQLKADAAAEIEEQKNKLDADFKQLVNSVEPDMVDALTSIYEHVFNVEFRENKAIILHLIKTTLGKMESGTDIIVHVSSDDYDMVYDEKPALEEAMGSPNSTLELIEDPLLKENECIIESEGGVFDCSLGVELAELSRKLKLLSYDRSKR